MGSPLTRIAESEAPKLARNLFGSMENELETTPTLKHLFFGDKALKPIDQALGNTLNDFVYQRNQINSQLVDPIHNIWKGVEADPQLRSAIGGRETPLNQVHQHLASTAHPLAAESQKLMNRSSKNATQSLLELHSKTFGVASTEARENVMGKNSKNIMPYMDALYSSPDPTWHSHADAVANMFSMVMKDRLETNDGILSAIKRDVRGYVKKEAGKGRGIAERPVSFQRATYTSTEEQEHQFNRWLTTVGAPFMAVPHIGTAFNVADSPASAIMKGIFNSGHAKIQRLIADSGILAATQHAIMDNHLRFQTGLIGKNVGHVAGMAVNTALHNPGFHTVRTWQLSRAGAIGYHAAIEWADQAARKGSRRAIAELEEMGLNPQAIIARGGNLTEDELKQGIFHYVNNRFFIDKRPVGSLYSGSNFLMRSATKFHSFVSYQASFMKKTLYKMASTGDYMGLAQFAGTLGVLFPAFVAPAMKSAETLLRTGSFSQAGQSMQDDYGNLLHPEDTSSFLKEYIDLMSHLGAMGVYFHYIQSAERFQLAKQVLGPGLGIGTAFVQDLITGAHGTKAGEHHWAPLGRDALRYGVPVFGGLLTHQLLPTEKEAPTHVRKRFTFTPRR